MPIKSRIRIVPHYCRVTYKMTDAMFYYTKTENCPIPTPTLPFKGRVGVGMGQFSVLV